MRDATTIERLDASALLALVQQTDALGVLSIYVDTAPSGLDPTRRAPGIEIKNRLAELERRVRSDGPPERIRALRACLDRLAPEIERLVDPRETGRGRALFASLGEEWLTRFTSQMQLPYRVVLDSSAFIHPLLELLDEGRPAGVVLGARDEADLLEWRLGELRRLERVELEYIEAPHERSGPIAHSPSGHHNTPMREQRKTRERERLKRLLGRVADATARLTGERGWERLLVSGGDRFTTPLVDSLSPGLREVAIPDPRLLAQLEPAELAAAVTERMHAEHEKHELRLAREVRDTALGTGAAAVGLSEVVAALNEARVAHLVYDPEVRYQGSIGEDGRLHARGESPPAPGRLVPDSRLTERIVERCLETGARISPVEGAAADVLEEAGGIAAVLRW